MHRALTPAVLAALVVAGCGGSSAVKEKTTTGSAAVVIEPDRALKAPGEAHEPAPEVALRDYLGHAFTLSSQRGKLVYITFVYAHCPDICPLILDALAETRRKLPDPSSATIVAISVDPKGDTRAAVAQLLKRKRLVGTIHYLVGARAQLLPVWTAFRVKASVDSSNPALVEHSAFVYAITPKGIVRALYPAGSPLSVGDLLHDAPILLKQ